jgi:hypothetical protein
VTRRARYALVRAVDPEVRVAIVIEAQLLPALEGVAATAVGWSPRTVELGSVGVPVTIGASGADTDPHETVHVPVRLAMTPPAGSGDVRPLQDRAGAGVIEGHEIPARNGVTTGTTRGARKPIETALVRVLVAVETSRGGEGEQRDRFDPVANRNRKLRGRDLPVAAIARRGAVCPLEGVVTDLMVREREPGGSEPEDVVAARAQSPIGPPRELPQVRVGVARGAAIEPLDREGTSGRVTLSALDRDVPALERVPATIVIERFGPGGAPTLDDMTARARRTESAEVDVTVAIAALGVRNAAEPSRRPGGGGRPLNHGLVTTVALDVSVFSHERVIAARVIEPCGLEPRLRMT